MGKQKVHHEHTKLGQWFATAICGNDILSSALYVSGIAAVFAGVYAPLVLLVIAGVLYCYKSVYTEVVEALPVNGGAYNCLLNSTSKTIAAIAGVTTLLSYVATAVISAVVAVEYVHTVVHNIPIIPSVIVLLGAFALLVISGLKDSAKLALFIFIFHVLSLTAFVIVGVIYYLNGHSHFAANVTETWNSVIGNNGVYKQMFLAFSASLLGVSGFESSANFVEEQKTGVFRKTLRNMLIGIAIFNPLIALVSLNSVSLSFIAESKEYLLAREASVIGGPIFQYVMVVNAFMVLSGAVLTSYVGVSGLVSRMAGDACLPEFLNRKNKKDSYWIIVLGFFGLCTSILLVTKGNILSLAGVYTIAFLSVMSLFAFGNLLLRFSRPELKRTYRAPIVLVVFAFFATAIGIVGNILIDKMNVVYFLTYFIPAVAVVLLVVYEDYVLRFLLIFTTKRFPKIHSFIERRFKDAIDGTIVVFINHVDRLYPILKYVHLNEKSRKIILVHCRNHDGDDDVERYNEIRKTIPMLEKAGVFPHLVLEYVYENEPFGPQAINNVAQKYKVHKNRVLVGSIHHFHDFDYHELGGVRIII